MESSIADFVQFSSTIAKFLFLERRLDFRLRLLSILRFSLRERCPHSELVWSVFSRIWTKYGEIVRMWENTDQNNTEYGHF